MIDAAVTAVVIALVVLPDLGSTIAYVKEKIAGWWKRAREVRRFFC